MTEIFKNQLMHELRQADYYDSEYIADKGVVFPVKAYPNVWITQSGVRYSADARPDEEDVAYGDLSDIYNRAQQAYQLWENRREMPGKHIGAENFRFLSEFGDIMLAARNDGARGFHYVTWQYNYNRTSVEHGHYTTSFADALEDYVTRSGLVSQDQIIDPSSAPLLYKALQILKQDYWLTKEHDEQINALQKQILHIDREVVGKSESIQLESAVISEYLETMEQEM